MEIPSKSSQNLHKPHDQSEDQSTTSEKSFDLDEELDDSRVRTEFVVGQSGEPVLVHNGYTYAQRYTYRGSQWWGCTHSEQYQCRATIQSHKGRVVYSSPHNH